MNMKLRRSRAAVVALCSLAIAGLAAVGTASPAAAAPSNGHFCIQQGVASTDADQTPHAAVCFTNYSAYMSHLSGGRIQLDPATKPTLPSRATLATINDQPASPAATYVLGILYDMDLYGGQQYTLTYTNHCSTSYTVQWASMPAFDNRTTSAKTADNCHHGTLYWDVSYGLPSYPFTNAVSNVGTTFNDKTSSAKMNP